MPADGAEYREESFAGTRRCIKGERIEALWRGSCTKHDIMAVQRDSWERPDVGPIVAGEQFLEITDYARQLDMHGLIVRGYLPKPGLMTYEEWKVWRAGPGCRPPGPEGRATRGRASP